MSEARQLPSASLDCVAELSKLLDTGLDRETLSICIALLETGVSPEVGRLHVSAARALFPFSILPFSARLAATPQALAEVVGRLRKQAAQAAQQAAAGGGGSGAGGR